MTIHFTNPISDMPTEKQYTGLSDQETNYFYNNRWLEKLTMTIDMIERYLKQQEVCKRYNQQIKSLEKLLQSVVHPQIERETTKAILIQYIMTIEICPIIFGRININKMDTVIDMLQKSVNIIFEKKFRKAITKKLGLSMASKSTEKLSGGNDFKQQITYLLKFYEKFYQAYYPQQAHTLGIVYTPYEVVNFMIRSTDTLLQKHFNTTLMEHNVKIIDPCTGTGNFISHLLHYLFEEYQDNDKLKYQYENRIFAMEISILPYFIAKLCIENFFFDITKKYMPFQKLTCQDTLELDNIHCIEEASQDITVIIGNPPYSGHRDNENAQNKHRAYPNIDQRIRDTYVANSISQKTKTFDTYVRFIRWASDHIQNQGIIAFISNNSFLDSQSFDGFRTSVANEFSNIYVVDLGGNVRKYLNDPNIFLGEKNTIFGKDAAIGVCITYFIKDIEHKKKGQIYYTHPFDILSLRTEKLEFLNRHTVENLTFNLIRPSKGHWLHTEETDFHQHMPVVSKNKKFNAIFNISSNGVVTSRDLWVYDLDKHILINKVNYFINTYNRLLQKYAGDAKAFGHKTIKWSRDLKLRYFRLNKMLPPFNTKQITVSLYRPFSSVYHYTHNSLNDVLTYKHYSIFGENLEQKNICIGFNGLNNSQWHPLASKLLVDLNCLYGGIVNLPLYQYQEGKRLDNITDWSLREFQIHYQDDSIKKLDIFYYVYAVFHHQDYVAKYKIDLQRNLPNIPFYHNFHALAESGKVLIKHHIDFEKIKKHPDVKIDIREGEIIPRCKIDKDKNKLYTGTILLDSHTTISNIPPKAFTYKLGHRSPIEWLIKQHTSKKPNVKNYTYYKIIFDKYNTSENELERYRKISRPYLIDLIPRLVTVSLKTLEIKEKIALHKTTR